MNYICKTTPKAVRDEFFTELKAAIDKKYELKDSFISGVSSRFELEYDDETVYLDIYMEKEDMKLHIHSDKPAHRNGKDFVLKYTDETVKKGIDFILSKIPTV